ncbi:hypothetical protein Dsin_008093 [Dipteronia sinensis]|uniref:Uncharacterized protein n=1 Tax=Dipteronia sinensis TaxID=43782 RepID=A0AAE0EH86_9ROSI|nr:hypothetical protein Dsin_008093 [Dipteronia sinensis]
MFEVGRKKWVENAKALESTFVRYYSRKCSVSVRKINPKVPRRKPIPLLNRSTTSASKMVLSPSPTLGFTPRFPFFFLLSFISQLGFKNITQRFNFACDTCVCDCHALIRSLTVMKY